jgi:hypothetical protein
MKDTLNEVLARFGGLGAKHHPMSPAMEADCLACIHSAYRAGVSSAEDTDDDVEDLPEDERSHVGRGVLSTAINVRALIKEVGESRAVQITAKNMRMLGCPGWLADKSARGGVLCEMRAESNFNTDKLNRERAAALAKTI